MRDSGSLPFLIFSCLFSLVNLNYLSLSCLCDGGLKSIGGFCDAAVLRPIPRHPSYQTCLSTEASLAVLTPKSGSDEPLPL